MILSDTNSNLCNYKASIDSFTSCYSHQCIFYAYTWSKLFFFLPPLCSARLAPCSACLRRMLGCSQTTPTSCSSPCSECLEPRYCVLTLFPLRLGDWAINIQAEENQIWPVMGMLQLDVLCIFFFLWLNSVWGEAYCTMLIVVFSDKASFFYYYYFFLVQISNV